jgi:tetratricopeptide (TPR) repeat protein
MTDSSSPQHGSTQTSDIPAVLRLPVQYWRQSLAAAALVLAAAGGYALFGVYQKGQVEKAEAALGDIITTKAGAERIAALEALAKTAPAGARTGINLELAKAAQNLGDFAKAASAFEAVAQTAPAGMKTIAGLGQAAALSRTGQDAKAVDVLESLTLSAPKNFAMTIDRQLAVTAEAAGQWQKALSAYERMKADGNVQNASFIDARIADLKAKTGGAAKTNG